MAAKLKELKWGRQDFLPNIVSDVLDDGAQLEFCCGVGVIGDFDENPSLDDIMDDITRYNANVRSYNQDLLDSGDDGLYLGEPDEPEHTPVTVAEVRRRLNALSYGLILATTNQTQKEPAAALALIGFRTLSVVRSPKSKNIITLWSYEVPKGKKRS